MPSVHQTQHVRAHCDRLHKIAIRHDYVDHRNRQLTERLSLNHGVSRQRETDAGKCKGIEFTRRIGRVGNLGRTDGGERACSSAPFARVGRLDEHEPGVGRRGLRVADGGHRA